MVMIGLVKPRKTLFVSPRTVQVCVPEAQTPDWQVSPVVHELPSLHVVPFARVGFEQPPVVGSQLPAAWHWSLAVHVAGLPPVHTPASHVSVCVHALPSLHDVPSVLAGFEQTPVPVLQTPTAWHWSLAVHVTGL